MENIDVCYFLTKVGPSRDKEKVAEENINKIKEAIVKSNEIIAANTEHIEMLKRLLQDLENGEREIFSGGYELGIEKSSTVKTVITIYNGRTITYQDKKLDILPDSLEGILLNHLVENAALKTSVSADILADDFYNERPKTDNYSAKDVRNAATRLNSKAEKALGIQLIDVSKGKLCIDYDVIKK